MKMRNNNTLQNLKEQSGVVWSIINFLEHSMTYVSLKHSTATLAFEVFSSLVCYVQLGCSANNRLYFYRQVKIKFSVKVVNACIYCTYMVITCPPRVSEPCFIRFLTQKPVCRKPWLDFKILSNLYDYVSQQKKRAKTRKTAPLPIE